jgi:hypothetical protein
VLRSPHSGSKRHRQHRRDDYVTRIEALLTDHGFEYRFERGRKHRYVVVRTAAGIQKFYFPFSGSDWRGPRNTVGDIRRALGLRGAP